MRTLIRRLARKNPDWGAPRIHGELLKLGLTMSERSVARYLRSRERRGDPQQRWLAFLQNHREAICAMDFFIVPTLTFRLLYGGSGNIGRITTPGVVSKYVPLVPGAPSDVVAGPDGAIWFCE